VSIQLILNGEERAFDGDADMPLLWYLRDHAGLTGTKFGCGSGLCGACTVLVDGRPRRSCVMKTGAAMGRAITTIEGLGATGLHPVQKAWIEEDVPQCGYCQGGQILAAVALLERSPDPTNEEIESITNLCRCGTYVRVRRAIARAAAELRAAGLKGAAS
jgi:isoquinoline 1-oxidoreductase alpha subunit